MAIVTSLAYVITIFKSWQFWVARGGSHVVRWYQQAERCSAVTVVEFSNYCDVIWLILKCAPRRSETHTFQFIVLLPFHPAILEPDFNLPLWEAESVRYLYSPPAREISIEMELFLQLERLVASVSCSSPFSIRSSHIWHKQGQRDNKQTSPSHQTEIDLNVRYILDVGLLAVSIFKATCSLVPLHFMALLLHNNSTCSHLPESGYSQFNLYLGITNGPSKHYCFCKTNIIGY